MDAAEIAKESFRRGAEIEEVVRELRNAGYRQMESVKALRAAGLSLREADEAVLRSKTWADEREATLQLREDLWAVIAEHADEISTDEDGRIEATFDLTKGDDGGTSDD